MILFYSTSKDTAAAGTRGWCWVGESLVCSEVTRWVLSEATSPISAGTVWPPGLGRAGAGVRLRPAEASEDSRGTLRPGQRRGWSSPACSFKITIFKPFPQTIPHHSGKRWAGYLLPQFTEEETEVQSHQMTCPKSHSKWMTKTETKPRTQCFPAFVGNSQP